ncbi:MAG: hypothetical protein ACYTKD_25690 [Planctomycetota bacterium]|jgi:hypothetical protein
MSPVWRRPETKITQDLRPWELVWDDRRGWGIVLGRPDVLQPYALSVRGEFDADEEPDEQPDPEHRVHWPDADLSELRPGPLARVCEPLKLRGVVEISLARADDPLLTVAPLGWGAVARTDAPRLFAVAHALHHWGCGGMFGDVLRPAAAWLREALEPVARGMTAATHRALRWRSDLHVGLLAGMPHIFARVLAAALPQDWEEAWARRRDEDREELIGRLQIGLLRAATPRGIDGARRRFLADLLALRRRHGSQGRNLWNQVKEQGGAMVRERLAEE